jgi:hypothetical protein
VHSADELIDSIVNYPLIPPGKRRREIQRELRSHVEDFVAAAREAGRSQDEIEELVLAHFGDPGQIAQGFAWVYRQERRRLRVFAYTLSTVLLASSLFAAILAMQAGLALGFGTPIINVLASRHTAIEALDIVASVAAYLGLILFESLFEKRPFQKTVLLLAVIFTVLTESGAAAGLHMTFLTFGLVNGVFLRTVQLFVTSKAARVAIVAVCFPPVGLFLASRWAPISHLDPAAICASWLAMGVGYLMMTELAARVDAALLEGLQRTRAGY